MVLCLIMQIRKFCIVFKELEYFEVGGLVLFTCIVFINKQKHSEEQCLHTESFVNKLRI